MTRQPWEGLVEAECAYRDRCAQLYAAGVMTEQLRLALADFSGRDMALRVLRDAPPETVLELLDPVFDLSVSLHGPLVPAREVLARLRWPVREPRRCGCRTRGGDHGESRHAHCPR